MKKHPLKKKVKTIEVKPKRSISKLLSEMSQTGFQGRKLAEVTDVLEEIIKDKSLTILMGYAGSLSNSKKSYRKAKGSKAAGTMGKYRNNTKAFKDNWSMHDNGHGRKVKARSSWAMDDNIFSNAKGMGTKNGEA